MLERMRMIDTANHWRDNTTKVYHRLLHKLHLFQSWSSIPTLVQPRLQAPPTSPCFALMYAQLQYSVEGRGHKFQTVRQLRSASAAWYTTSCLQEYPDLREGGNAEGPCEALLYRHFSESMSRRMGIEVNPSMALTHVQVAFLDQTLEMQWQMSC